MKRQIGIIGFGNFGQFLAEHLKQQFEVFVTDKENKTNVAKALGIEFTTIKKVASKEIVMLAVPTSSIRETLLKIRSFLNPNSLVLDVCSIKKEPIELMKKILPKDIEILGTHPLFGPNTFSKNKKVVLCPVRIDKNKFKKIKNLLENLGLETIVTTPAEHDKQMSSQALAHFIGKILSDINLEENDISTHTSSILFELKGIIEKHSPELFGDIQRLNGFSSQLRQKFIEESLRINENLKGGKIK